MNGRIVKYLALSYRRTVLGESVDPDAAIEDNTEFKTALQAELSRIRGLGIDNLAQRDFVSYQAARAIEAALAKLEKKDATGEER